MLFELHFIIFICSWLETRKCDAKHFVLFCFFNKEGCCRQAENSVSIYGRKPQTYIRGDRGGTGCRQAQHSPLDAVKSMATVK